MEKHSKSETSQFIEMVIVPKKMLQTLQDGQDKILNLIENIPENKLPKGTIANKYIPESKAKEMLGKGTTWFWQMRKEKKLKYKKIGNKIFYTIEEIENLFENSTNN